MSKKDELKNQIAQLESQLNDMDNQRHHDYEKTPAGKTRPSVLKKQ